MAKGEQMAVLERSKGHVLTGILPSDIDAKRRDTKIGDTVSVKTWRETEDGTYKMATMEGVVLAKFKHIVVTTAGDFQWKQLLIENPRARG